jgi:hypothetical protein
MASFAYSAVAKRLIEVKSPKDIPTGHHFAISIWSSNTYTTEGDERSRTNPGHGYPSETITYDTQRHYITTNEADWKEAVALLFEEKPYRTDVVAIEVLRRAVPVMKVEVL